MGRNRMGTGDREGCSGVSEGLLWRKDDRPVGFGTLREKEEAPVVKSNDSWDDSIHLP